MFKDLLCTVASLSSPLDPHSGAGPLILPSAKAMWEIPVDGLCWFKGYQDMLVSENSKMKKYVCSYFYSY